MTVGQVTLRTTDRKHALTAWLGPNEPTMAGGVGGWSPIQRPRKTATIEWLGADPITGTLELLLDSYRAGGTVSAAVAAARVLAPLRPSTEPPVFNVYGCPHLSSTVPFTAQALDLSGWELRHDGQPVRVTATFTLLEYAVGDVITRSSPAKRAATRSGSASRTGGKTRTYTVHRGDTLGSIAARLLGSSARWTEISKLNALRDPNHVPVGKVLKIPAK